MDIEKAMQELVDNKMCDRKIFVYCTKWNASMGASAITVYGNDLFITPFTGGVYGFNIKKAQKISKNDIESITAKKSCWTGASVSITLKDGKKLKYKLINNSWLQPAEELCAWMK